MTRFLAVLSSATIWLGAVMATAETPLKVLFLGDNGHHQPAARFQQLQPVLAGRGIELTYTDKLEDLNPVTLEKYDALAIYANHTQISPAQEKALLDYVESGHGLVPLHCASFCFLNSPKYIELVGGQFKSHSTGVFRETIVMATHPVMKGLKEIESWDETYVHDKLNPNKTVLANRVEGNHTEPYTWVREQGKGRVFYTAWGHDERTWGNANFQDLVEHGIRWAAGVPISAMMAKAGLKPFEYSEADVAFYNPKSGGPSTHLNVMQKPLPAEESVQHLVMQPEFEARLFASDPEIWKPICMAFDARGRLWIAETTDYPNELQPSEQGHDRIVICEDTHGKGRADKFTVFADKLSVPTSMTFSQGGVIVQQAPDTLFLKDTDGDDKADVRKVLFSGWGTGDTHAGPSNIRWGFDNWIWGVVGYSGFRGTVGGEKREFPMGFYRFRPDGAKLEYLRSSNNNTWGFSWNEEGIAFGSTANNNAYMYLPIPNRYYEAVNGWSASRVDSIADSQQFYPVTEKIRQVDCHGNYTAGAGAAIYTARNFPKEYWNRAAFVTEPTGHLVGRFFLEPHGADFVAHNARSLLASDDEWTAPIAAEVGPDGAVWVLDWYNYIIQHNPTPSGFKTGKHGAYETPLRDKVHGRIYRVVQKGAKSPPPLNLEKASPKELVATLKNDNLLWRMHAQRLLVERGQTDVLRSLYALITERGVDAIGLQPTAMHALWTLHGLGALEGSNREATGVAKEALKHPVPSVRRAAVNVLPRTTEGLSALLEGKLLNDPDAQVRLATFLALAEMPASDVAGAAIFTALQEERNAKDRWIPHAITAAAARQDAGFLKTVLGNVRVDSPNQPTVAANLLNNGSFEEETAGKPLGWRTVAYGGNVEFSLSNSGHTGGRAVQIRSTQGSDASWSQEVKVKPNADYRLSAWIKTENIAGATGALLNVHELQGAVSVKTPALTGTKDWTKVQIDFNSADRSSITVNALFGGWGFSTGTAWYDDLELTPAAPDLLPGEVGRVVRIVTGHYAQRGPVESVVPTLLALKGASPRVAEAVLDGLVNGWPKEKPPALTAADGKALVALMKSLSDDARSQLMALTDRWGRKDLFGEEAAKIASNLLSQLTDAKLSAEQRATAANRLLLLNDQPATIQTILAQVTTQTPPALANGLIGALAASHQPQTGNALIGRWASFTPTARQTALAMLMRRAEWTQTLLDAVENKALAKTDLGAEHWQQLKTNPDKKIAARAKKLQAADGGASSADLEAVLKKLLPLADEKGDRAQGQQVFEKNCMVCHTFNGKGGKVGPELTGVAARPRKDILTDILDPNRSVEANFRNWTVTTQDGETLSGRLDGETQTTIEILDLTGQKHLLQRKDITNLQSSNLSIMPTGFDALPAEDLKGLLEFLTPPQGEKK